MKYLVGQRPWIWIDGTRAGTGRKVAARRPGRQEPDLSAAFASRQPVDEVSSGLGWTTGRAVRPDECISTIDVQNAVSTTAAAGRI